MGLREEMRENRFSSVYRSTIIIASSFALPSLLIVSIIDGALSNFFEISLGSIAEVAAALDLAAAFGLMRVQERDGLKSRLLLAAVKIRALP